MFDRLPWWKGEFGKPGSPFLRRNPNNGVNYAYGGEIMQYDLSEKKMKKLLEPLFEEKDHQQDVIVAIYKKFIPDYDDIEKISGYPKCGKVMNVWLVDKFIEFDKKHHPEVMAGGAWALGFGFSSSEKMGWEVSLKNCAFTYAHGKGENYEKDFDIGSDSECLAMVAVG
jgi:hypothetical protein